MARDIFDELAAKDAEKEKINIFDQLAAEDAEREKINIFDQLAAKDRAIEEELAAFKPQGAEYPQPEPQVSEPVGPMEPEYEPEQPEYESYPKLPETMAPRSGGEFWEPEEKERLSQAYSRGTERSATSLMLNTLKSKPEAPKEAPNDENWLEHLASMAGELIYDLPVMFAGAKAGGLGGAALGTIVPGIGTVGGASIGASAGAFALPTMIKQSYAEYEDWKRSGNEGTFGNFLERSARVLKETGKSALVGVVTGKVAKLLPFIRKIPGMDTVLNSGVGRAATTAGLEVGAMTGTESALEGRFPSLRNIADSALMMVAMKGAHAAATKIPVGKFIKVGGKVLQRTAEGTAKVIAPEGIGKRATQVKDVFQKLELQKKAEAVYQKAKKAVKETTPKDVVKVVEKTAKAVPKVVTRAAKATIKTAPKVVKAIPKVVKGIPSAAEKVKNIMIDSATILLKPELRKKFIKKILSSTPDRIKTVAQGIKELPGKTTQLAKALGFKDLNPEEKVFFEWLEDHVGERDARFMESQFKWNNEVLRLQEKLGRPFTKQELNDAIYYRQKTRNPNVKNDTYGALQKRIVPEIKELVSSIDNHFKVVKEEINKNPLMRDINARPEIEDRYLPGLYKYDAKKFPRVAKHLSKQFKTANDFANMKKFTTLLEASEKAGLVPLYDNIVDAARMFDNIYIKRSQNAELINRIKLYHEENPDAKKIIIVPKTAKQLRKAKADGYVPFEDTYLRNYVRGKNADGTLKWATSNFPAMLDPDFAQAFQGVFKRNINDHPSASLQAYDILGQALKMKNVFGSFYHYVPLIESAVSSEFGPKVFKFNEWLEEGKSLLNSKEFMVDAARHNVDLHGPLEAETYKSTEKGLNKLYELTKKYGSIAKIPVKTMQGFTKIFGHLFTTFHPRLKAVTWNAYNNIIIDKLTKAGETITPERMTKIKRGTAKLVNNLLGGQKWSIMPFFNDPANLKMVHRLVAYPNWNVSSVRQFLLGIKTPEYLAELERTPSGRKIMMSLGRKYWLRYGAYTLGTTAALRFLSSGVKQTREDASLSGLRFDVNKAFDGLINGDPTKFLSFPLIDANIRIPGTNTIFNMGRDKKGAKLYSRFGKQFLENINWLKHPSVNAFNKLHPIPQLLLKQAFGITPTKDGWWHVRGVKKDGMKVSWDGAKKYSPQWFWSHSKELFSDIFKPYSLGTLTDKGFAPWLFTALGSLPLSKGINLHSATPLIKKAILKKDIKSLNNIVKLLKDNAIEGDSIKNRIQSIKNNIIKERKS